MAIKHDELKNPQSTLGKAFEDEPLFILRGQDVTSPRVILHWMAKNFESVTEAKLRDAFEIALAMKKWPRRKQSD